MDDNGGITSLAKHTNIPQPSLSRFFNSASMSHRITLLKIVKSLNNYGVKIATYWQNLTSCNTIYWRILILPNILMNPMCHGFNKSLFVLT